SGNKETGNPKYTHVIDDEYHETLITIEKLNKICVSNNIIKKSLKKDGSINHERRLANIYKNITRASPWREHNKSVYSKLEQYYKNDGDEYIERPFQVSSKASELPEGYPIITFPVIEIKDGKIYHDAITNFFKSLGISTMPVIGLAEAFDLLGYEKNTHAIYQGLAEYLGISMHANKALTRYSVIKKEVDNKRDHTQKSDSSGKKEIPDVIESTYLLDKQYVRDYLFGNNRKGDFTSFASANPGFMEDVDSGKKTIMDLLQTLVEYDSRATGGKAKGIITNTLTKIKLRHDGKRLKLKNIDNVKEFLRIYGDFKPTPPETIQETDAYEVKYADLNSPEAQHFASSINLGDNLVNTFTSANFDDLLEVMTPDEARAIREKLTTDNGKYLGLYIAKALADTNPDALELVCYIPGVDNVMEYINERYEEQIGTLTKEEYLTTPAAARRLGIKTKDVDQLVALGQIVVDNRYELMVGEVPLKSIEDYEKSQKSTENNDAGALKKEHKNDLKEYKGTLAEDIGEFRLAPDKIRTLRDAGFNQVGDFINTKRRRISILPFFGEYVVKDLEKNVLNPLGIYIKEDGYYAMKTDESPDTPLDTNNTSATEKTHYQLPEGYSPKSSRLVDNLLTSYSLAVVSEITGIPLAKLKKAEDIKPVIFEGQERYRGIDIADMLKRKGNFDVLSVQGFGDDKRETAKYIADVLEHPEKLHPDYTPIDSPLSKYSASSDLPTDILKARDAVLDFFSKSKEFFVKKEKLVSILDVYYEISKEAGKADDFSNKIIKRLGTELENAKKQASRRTNQSTLASVVNNMQTFLEMRYSSNE
ncbi:MAG: hypothetical protein V1870_00200, partial [Candidatus Aenigmatarchaeota archaeon]